MTKANGERVVVDPALTTSRVYMYFYFVGLQIVLIDVLLTPCQFINVGSLIGQGAYALVWIWA